MGYVTRRRGRINGWQMTCSHKVVPHGASLKFRRAVIKSPIVQVDISSVQTARSKQLKPDTVVSG